MAQDPLYNTIPELILSTVENLSNVPSLESISCALTEMRRLYGNNEAYFIMPTTGNGCVYFSPEFLFLARYAMNTDCILYMSAEELELWHEFVNYEDTGVSNLLRAAEALDQYFMDLYNCVEPNSCYKICECKLPEKVRGDFCFKDPIIPDELLPV